MLASVITAKPAVIPTGIPGLDSVLRGGLRQNSIVLVEGLPGTGKTILATEIARRGIATRGDATLYISFEMSEDAHLSNFDSFDWAGDLLTFGDRFRFLRVEPGRFIEELLIESSQLRQAMKASGASRIVLDSLTPLRLYYEDQGAKAYRDFLRTTFDTFRAEGLITFVVTETEPSHKLGETGAGPEHFLADTVITLRKDGQRRSVLRSIEIAKSRGQNVLPGRHSIRIDSTGISVYARAYARGRFEPPPTASSDRVPFGIAGIEDMLGGGVYKGSSTLVVGISGTGKTVSAMHFLQEGLKRGETCLLASLDDSPAQFLRNATQLGFDFQGAIDSGKLIFAHESPLEIELDAHFAKIEAAVVENEVTRAVIDSLATYESLLPTECRDFMISLSGLLRSLSVTTLLAYECDELLGLSQISKDLKASSLADNIVLLNYVEISTTLRRAMTVPKSRGGVSEHQTREYVIKNGGLFVLDEATVPTAEKVPQLPLSCYYGVLARSPTRHSPIIDESVAAGKPMPKSKIPKPVKKSKSQINSNDLQS